MKSKSNTETSATYLTYNQEDNPALRSKLTERLMLELNQSHHGTRRSKLTSKSSRLERERHPPEALAQMSLLPRLELPDKEMIHQDHGTQKAELSLLETQATVLLLTTSKYKSHLLAHLTTM